MPTPIYPQTLHLGLALTPCSGSILGMACSEHCGVLRSAWSNVDEAWGSPVRGLCPELLSDVSLSAQWFSACKYKSMLFIFLFVATNERGPGGIGQVAEMEDWDKVRRQVPWAGPPPLRTREVHCSLKWLFRIVELHISLYVRCKCSVDFS